MDMDMNVDVCCGVVSLSSSSETKNSEIKDSEIKNCFTPLYR